MKDNRMDFLKANYHAHTWRCQHACDTEREYIEAAIAQGFSRYAIFRRIILPNIVSSALPLIGNQLIICLKDTAFLSIITVQEITAAANSVQATYFIPFNAFIVAIGLYWAISILLELLIKRLTAWGAKRGMSHA